MDTRSWSCALPLTHIYFIVIFHCDILLWYLHYIFILWYCYIMNSALTLSVILKYHTTILRYSTYIYIDYKQIEKLGITISREKIKTSLPWTRNRIRLKKRDPWFRQVKSWILNCAVITYMFTSVQAESSREVSCALCISSARYLTAMKPEKPKA